MSVLKKRVSLGLIVVVVFVLLVISPIVFIFTNSFMSAREAEYRYTSHVTAYNVLHSKDGEHYADITLLPDLITAAAYESAVVDNPTYHRLFWNQALIALPILLGQLLISPLAAYGFEMLKFRRKEILYFVYIIVMLLPLQLLMVPHYIAAETFGYNGTYWAIILPGLFAPFGTFLIRQQLKGHNKATLEAARTEGASEWTVFRRAVLPVIKPTMAALAVLTFADCWNIVDQAVVFIKSTYEEPLSVYLSRLISDSPGLVFASACVFMLPAVLAFLLSHDYLAHGIALTTEVSQR